MLTPIKVPQLTMQYIIEHTPPMKMHTVFPTNFYEKLIYDLLQCDFRDDTVSL